MAGKELHPFCNVSSTLCYLYSIGYVPLIIPPRQLLRVRGARVQLCNALRILMLVYSSTDAGSLKFHKCYKSYKEYNNASLLKKTVKEKLLKYTLQFKVADQFRTSYPCIVSLMCHATKMIEVSQIFSA